MSEIGEVKELDVALGAKWRLINVIQYWSENRDWNYFSEKCRKHLFLENLCTSNSNKQRLFVLENSERRTLGGKRGSHV